jgi:cytochrome c-type biogenesis protein CcmE
VTAPARPAQKRARYVAAAVVCGLVVVIGVVLIVVLADNVIYFRSVSEAVADRKNQGSDRFRIAGDVVLTSYSQRGQSTKFDITDGKKTVTVINRGDVPAIFKRNLASKQEIPVLCEGHWGKGLTFESERILIKHGEDYTPPRVDAKGTKGR